MNSVSCLYSHVTLGSLFSSEITVSTCLTVRGFNEITRSRPSVQRLAYREGSISTGCHYYPCPTPSGKEDTQMWGERGSLLPSEILTSPTGREAEGAAERGLGAGQQPRPSRGSMAVTCTNGLPSLAGRGGTGRQPISAPAPSRPLAQPRLLQGAPLRGLCHFLLNVPLPGEARERPRAGQYLFSLMLILRD